MGGESISYGIVCDEIGIWSGVTSEFGGNF